MVMGIEHFSKWIEMIALSKKFVMGYQFKQTSLTSFSPLFLCYRKVDLPTRIQQDITTTFDLDNVHSNL
jgi:hypothetical protein